MFYVQRISKGLGQLEAYILKEEGVAFQMDNQLIWDSLGRGYAWAIQGLFEKMESSKFWIILLPSGKIMLRDWIGMFLAPMSVGADPNTYPVLPVTYTEDPSLQFEVFYRKNKVAFRASNGLFLARVYRGFHTIEAAKGIPDDTCFFRPMIGDLYIPKFKIRRVTSSDFSAVKCKPYVLKKKKFINSSDVPQTHTFSMTWETIVTDRVVWKHLWGLGFANSHPIRICGMPATVTYTEDNERTVFVPRRIYEKQRKEVVVPPKSICIAHLLVNKCDNAAFPFKATVRKVKSNGDVVTLHEKGTWAGLLYRDIRLAVEIEQYRHHRCSIM